MTTKIQQENLLATATALKEAYRPDELVQLARLISPVPASEQMTAEEFEEVMSILATPHDWVKVSDWLPSQIAIQLMPISLSLRVARARGLAIGAMTLIIQGKPGSATD